MWGEQEQEWVCVNTPKYHKDTDIWLFGMLTLKFVDTVYDNFWSIKKLFIAFSQECLQMPCTVPSFMPTGKIL